MEEPQRSRFIINERTEKMFVYADNAATTCVSKTAAEAMMPYLTTCYGNPSSLYSFAQKAKEALEDKVIAITASSCSFPERELNEAKEYLANPTLRARLTEISTALLELSTDDAESVFGYLDAMKVRSSMTLFKHADEGCEIWNAVLEKFFGGQEDWRTLSLIEK